MNSIYKYSRIVIGLLFLSGCGFGTASLTLHPSEKMNLDDLGKPLTTKVWFYQLKSNTRMEKADFKLIWKNDKGVLDDHLLEKKEFLIYPGKKVAFKFEKKEGANFIAVMALFRKPDKTTGGWKKIVKLKAWGMTRQRVHMILKEDRIELGIYKIKKQPGKKEQKKKD